MLVKLLVGGTRLISEVEREDEVDDLDIKTVIANARDIAAGTGPPHISFDIDSLDPAFAPGAGTPEVGDLTSAQAHGIQGVSGG